MEPRTVDTSGLAPSSTGVDEDNKDAARAVSEDCYEDFGTAIDSDVEEFESGTVVVAYKTRSNTKVDRVECKLVCNNANGEEESFEGLGSATENEVIERETLVSSEGGNEPKLNAEPISEGAVVGPNELNAGAEEECFEDVGGAVDLDECESNEPETDTLRESHEHESKGCAKSGYTRHQPNSEDAEETFEAHGTAVDNDVGELDAADDINNNDQKSSVVCSHQIVNGSNWSVDAEEDKYEAFGNADKSRIDTERCESAETKSGTLKSISEHAIRQNASNIDSTEESYEAYGMVDHEIKRYKPSRTKHEDSRRSQESEKALKELWILRHADRGDDKDGDHPAEADLLYQKRLAAHFAVDPPITEGGIERTRKTASELLNVISSPFARVISSPFLRCLQTAMVVAETMNFSGCIEVDHGFCEVMDPLVIKLQITETSDLTSSEDLVYSIDELEEMYPGYPIIRLLWSVFSESFILGKFIHLSDSKMPELNSETGHADGSGYDRFKYHLGRVAADECSAEQGPILIVSHGHCVAAGCQLALPGTLVYTTPYCAAVGIYGCDDNWSMLCKSEEFGVGYIDAS